MIMKKNNIYLAAAAALLALAACNKELAPEAGDITIDASIGAMTKVSYDGASTSFTAGDEVSVYAWMGDATAVPDTRVVDGVRNTLGTDGKWTPATQMRWRTVTDAHYFLGVYPAKDITDFTADAYTLDPAAAAYTASDLLIATNLTGVKASDGAVALNFDHAMAKLDVNLKFRSQWDATPTVSSVTVTAKKTATVNYLTKAVTATGDASAVDIPAAATAATGYALSYSGLQVPQTGMTTVTVTIDSKEYVYESTTDIPLESGKYTTLGLIVGKDKLELGSISVTDWEAGTTLPDGDAMLTFKHNGYEYVDMGEVNINGVTKHLFWATCNVGADYPWDYGDYYAWGETATKSEYSWDTYSMGDGTAFSKYTGSDYTTLQSEDDVASKLWGGSWRIPTDEEWQALREQFTWLWTTQNEVNGRLVTAANGNSIFLPAAGGRDGTSLFSAGSVGYYCSSSLYEVYPHYSWSAEFSSGSVYRYYLSRYCGLSVRPVFCERYPLAAADVATIDIGKVLAADGNIYADAAQATAAGTEARAVIAYVGSVPNYFDKFLAIALENTGSSVSWADASTAVGTYAGSHAITIGGTPYNTNAIGDTYYDQVINDVNVSSASRTTGVVKGWRIPSVTDWRYVFDGLGRQKAGLTLTAKSGDGNTTYSSNATPTDPLGIESMYYYKDGDAEGASSLREAINAACGNTALQVNYYWTSSDWIWDSAFAWCYVFHDGRFASNAKGIHNSVRAVFAY